MSNQKYICEKCGEIKRLFFVKSPIRLAITILGLLAVFIVGYMIEDHGLRLVVMYIGATVFSIPFLSLIRIRCLQCEPAWKEKAWILRE
jgi:hypothetical protein